ncbi:MAG: polymer-forming cytoskeletal protein [Oceanicaulis sp.]|nr:polymer-forming cytoskeletal protein [Oceanicaulis sp.]
MKSKAPSILSADLVVHGSIMSEGEVQLDGTVEGDVRAGSLTIGEEANVKGEVVAETVVIRGRVQGSVRARQVQLASTARVEGDVIHATLSIESGAFFDGHCRRSTDPMTDKATAKPAARTDAPSSPGASAAPKPAEPQPQAQSSSFGKPATPAAPPPSAANAPKA